MSYTRTRFLEHWPGFEIVRRCKRAAQNEARRLLGGLCSQGLIDWRLMFELLYWAKPNYTAASRTSFLSVKSLMLGKVTREKEHQRVVKHSHGGSVYCCTRASLGSDRSQKSPSHKRTRKQEKGTWFTSTGGVTEWNFDGVRNSAAGCQEICSRYYRIWSWAFPYFDFSVFIAW